MDIALPNQRFFSNVFSFLMDIVFIQVLSPTKILFVISSYIKDIAL
jgi:hypothetical protein